ncbi:MotE family protein [Aneurinibacillus sp. BA2021]|nr:MotE family protein [Aneurinibacillus sp. BA2021]
MEEMEELEEERSYSRLEWFFYIIFIPLLFTLALSAIIAQMFGYNVVGVLAKELNKIPYVEKIIPDAAVAPAKESAEEKPITKKEDEKISDLETRLATKEREVAELKKKAELDQQKMKQLEQQRADNQASASEEQKKTDEEKQKQIKSLAKIYTTMSAGKAAPILEKMAPEEAAQLLLVMKAEERSGIMAKMDPKKAADLSLLLKETSLGDSADPTVLQQRLLEVKYNTSVRELASSISSMQPANAADLVERLFKADEKKAVYVLSQMEASQRGQILSELAKDKTRAALAAKISQKLLAY